jgi:flagellar biogenesis protein FliO
MTDGIPGLVDVARTFAALALVIAVVLVAGWFMRRHTGGRRARLLLVEERLPLARGVQLVVVSAEGRRLLLGVSEKSVQLVTDLETGDEDATAATVAEAEPGHPARPLAVGMTPGVADFAQWLTKTLRTRRSRP